MTKPVVIVADVNEAGNTQLNHPTSVARSVSAASRQRRLQDGSNKLPVLEEDEEVVSVDYELSIPPEQIDKGYAYVVFAAAFITVFLTIGPAFTLGVYYNALLREFHASNAAVSVVPGLHTGTLLVAGAAASYLIERFGFRWTTFYGGLLAALGFALSYFATELWHLYITLGIISGVGAGVAHITGYGIIGFYFEKKRHVASLLFMVSSGAGCLAMAPLNEWLIETYTWRGAFLITAGIVLHTLPCGLMMHDPVLQSVVVPVEETAVRSNQHLEIVNDSTNHTAPTVLAMMKSSVSLAPSVRSRTLSSSHNNLYSRHISQCREPEVLSKFMSVNDNAGDSDGDDEADESSVTDAGEGAERKLTMLKTDAVTPVQPGEIELDNLNSSTITESLLADVNIKARADNALLQHHNNSTEQNVKASRSNLSESGEKSPLYNGRKSNSRKSTSASSNKKSRQTNKTNRGQASSVGQRVVRDECFWLIMLHSLFMGVYSYTTTAIIPYAVNECGFSSERATFVLSFGAFVSVIIRLVLAGLACTRLNKRINYFVIFHVATLIMSVAICVLPYVGKISENRDFPIFGMYALIAAMWGLKFGVYAGIMMDVLGPKALGFVWGIGSFINAFACATAPVIGGWLVDVTQSFTLAFVLTGILSAVAGLPMLVAHGIWLKRERAKKVLKKKGEEGKKKTG